MSTLETWVQLARDKGASDLHLEPGSPLVLRIRGELAPLGEPLAAEPLMETARQLLGPKRWQDFIGQRSADLSQTIGGVRCRVNAYQTLRGVSLAIRVLSTFRNTVHDCNLHPDLLRFLKSETGLLLVSGPTGSGKSTTLAAFVEELNATKRRHIITVESPIEYFFRNRKSFIRQREVRSHTPSFEQAIIDSMRQDPDVLVIGEMRTPDVMRLTLNAAETGHLVFSTIHSSTCAEALARLCMSFPSDIQSAICNQVADCLLGVVCQRLVYLPKFQLRVPHCEVMVATSAVKAVVRSGQFSKIVSSIQTGGDDGMWTFDRYGRWIAENQDWQLASARGAGEEREESPPAPEPPPSSKEPAQRAIPMPPSVPSPPLEPDPGRIEIADAGDDLDSLFQGMTKRKKETD